MSPSSPYCRLGIPVAALAVAFVAALTPPARGQEVSLSPSYKPGQRWSSTFEIRWEMTESVFNGQTLPADTVVGVNAAGGAWVMAAENGEYRQVLFQFGRCENTQGTKGQQNPAVTVQSQSNKDFVLLREVSPITDEARVRVIRRQKLTGDIDPNFEDSLKVSLESDLFPKTPVKVGDKWTSKMPAAIFGAGHEGTMEMQLARVLRGDDGRDKAIVNVVRAEVSRGVGSGTTAVAQFTGNIRVDLTDRIPDLMELRGTASQKTNMGGLASEMRGPWMCKTTIKLLPAKPPTPEQVQSYAQDPAQK